MVSSSPPADLDYGLFDRVDHAWLWLRDRRPAPALLKVVGDDDSDGTTSAYVLSHALQAQGYDVEIELRAIHDTDDVDLAMAGRADAVVIADSGSAFLEYLDSFSMPVLVFDHHRVRDYEPRNVYEVNPRRLGGDQVDFVSASVVCQLFAEAIDPANRSTAFAAVAGGIADRQHLSGFHGLIDHLIDRAVEAGHTDRRPGLTLPGRTVAEAVNLSLDPYFDGLTGEPAACEAFLRDLDVDPHADPRALDEPASRRVAEALTARLEEVGAVTDRIYPVLGLMLPLEHDSGVPTLFALTRVLETLTAEDAFELALDVLRGDARAAAEGWQRHRDRTFTVLKELGAMRDRVRDLGHVRVAESKDTTDTGIYAHTLLTYVYGDDKPFVAYAAAGPKVKFSARGSPRLTAEGADLSIAMQEAAEAFGGNGGGHPGASGAAVKRGDLDAFLDRLNETIGRIRKGGAA